LVEAEPLAGRPCRVWFGIFGDDYKMIGDPVLEYSGRIGRPSTRESGRGDDGVISADLTITIESRWAFGTRAKLRRRTDADHQAEHPGDTCFRFAAQQTNLVVQGWGR